MAKGQKAKAQRPKRSQADLQVASRHVYHEYRMFRAMVSVMETGAIDGLVGNAILEGFTIHCRALLDFTFSKNPRPDDIIADDFFATPAEWLRGKLA